MNALSVPRAGSGYGKRALSASPFQTIATHAKHGGFLKGGGTWRRRIYTPLLGSFSLFLFSCFFNVFLDVFWIFLGSSWELIGVTLGVDFSMKNCIDLLLDFWMVFGSVLDQFVDDFHNFSITLSRRVFNGFF